MAVKSFIKSSGLAALAASVALTALPGNAAAQEGRRWGGDRGTQAQSQGQGEQHRNWGNRGGESRGWERRSEVQQQQQQQAQPQLNYQRRWSGGETQQRQAEAQQQVQPQRQWGEQRRWSGGDRQISDEQRREWAARSQQRTDTWRDRQVQQNAYQQGYRQGRTYDTYRDRRDEQRAYSGGYRQGYSTGWNRDWRRDNRYDWSGWRNQNRDVFRMGRYYSPYRNWSYRPLSIGFSLQPLFYSRTYWISDPWSYRLPEVDGPYRWVRYYDDALLVDIYSGEVVDVIRDIFW